MDKFDPDNDLVLISYRNRDWNGGEFQQSKLPLLIKGRQKALDYVREKMPTLADAMKTNKAVEAFLEGRDFVTHSSKVVKLNSLLWGTISDLNNAIWLDVVKLP